MSAWAIKDKAKTWDAICDSAWAGELLFITRGDTQTVVLISYGDYQPLRIKRRHVVRNPKLTFKISEEDLFADDSSMWRRMMRKPLIRNLAVVIKDRRYVDYGVRTLS